MNLALHAISLLRESYSNSDKVRFHGIVSDGGKSVNILPDRIEMDYMLRAETVEKLLEVNRRFDNAVKYAAMAAECGCEIETIHYSMPLYDDLKLGKELENVVKTIFPESSYDFNGSFYASCTDMGDVATVIPAVHGYVPGAIGSSHSKSYFVNNYYTGCIYPALIGSRLVIELLYGDAEKGKAIAARKADLMPIPEYIKLLDSLSTAKSASPDL
jgi:metal-dependent amidase/aminoacylase/carboxypeptidase family protein